MQAEASPDVPVVPLGVEAEFVEDFSPLRAEAFPAAQVVRAITDQMEYLAGSVAARQAQTAQQLALLTRMLQPTTFPVGASRVSDFRGDL